MYTEFYGLADLNWFQRFGFRVYEAAVLLELFDPCWGWAAHVSLIHEYGSPKVCIDIQ